jgi:hypothetical protein
MRRLPPELEEFCEGKLQSLGETENRRISAALFVHSLQAKKVPEVEKLARHSERQLRELLTQTPLASVVAGIKGSGVLLPHSVAASVLELTQESQAELGDMDVDAFKRDIVSLQVGLTRVRDREPANRRLPCSA